MIRRQWQLNSFFSLLNCTYVKISRQGLFINTVVTRSTRYQPTYIYYVWEKIKSFLALRHHRWLEFTSILTALFSNGHLSDTRDKFLKKLVNRKKFTLKYIYSRVSIRQANTQSGNEKHDFCIHTITRSIYIILLLLLWYSNPVKPPWWYKVR